MEGPGPQDCRECLSPLSQLGSAAGALAGLDHFSLSRGPLRGIVAACRFGPPCLIYANHLFTGQLTYLLCLSVFFCCRIFSVCVCVCVRMQEEWMWVVCYHVHCYDPDTLEFTCKTWMSLCRVEAKHDEWNDIAWPDKFILERRVHFMVKLRHLHIFFFMPSVFFKNIGYF